MAASSRTARAQAIYDTPANLFVAGFATSPPMNLVQGSLKQERDSLLFTEAGDGTIALRLPISPEYSGKTIVLGIRPEDIEVGAPGAERSASGFKALVDRIEPKGCETDLYLQTGGHELVCRSRRWIDPGEGGRRFQFEINLANSAAFRPSFRASDYGRIVISFAPESCVNLLLPFQGADG